jgi:hypothetical protein
MKSTRGTPFLERDYAIMYIGLAKQIDTYDEKN